MTNLDTIAQAAIAKLGANRAREANNPQLPPEPNKVGFAGVDVVRPGKYRARIRFCNALTGEDTRVTLGTFDSAENAGYAYRAAHLHLWGVCSYFSGVEL